MKKRLEKMQKALPDEELLKKPISRKTFVAGAGATSFGLLLAACGGDDEEAAPAPPPAATTGAAPTPPPAGEGAPLKEGLADGMYGGPVGFEGAERYQYPFDSEEGRAIAALRQLVQDGNAPDTLVVQVLDGAEGHLTVGFPEGAPSLEQLFEEETGIKIKRVLTTPETNYTDNLQNLSTKNGNFDIVQTAITDTGDFAEGGLLRDLDEFVAKYQPSWSDATYGYEGGEQVAKLFNSYNGKWYTVAFDNDTQPWFYRSDLLESAEEQAAFEDKYSRPLEFPKTWEDFKEVAEFFTRPDADVPLYGDVSVKSPFWGIVNWQQRFVSQANPNMYFFNEDGSANIANDAGYKAAEEHVEAVKWSDPKTLTKIWIDQYALMGAGNGFMGGSFPNMTKILPGNPDLDTGGFGKFIKSELAPGRLIDGNHVRRPVIFFNIAWGVNGFSDPARHEAAYLFLQWAGGARVYTWLTQNPAGFMDPHHSYSFTDPGVIGGYEEGQGGYKPQPTETLKRIIPYTAPPILLRGAAEYTNALDLELQKALTGQKSPKAAIDTVAQQWDKITDRIGVDQQSAALKAGIAAWPTAVDPA
jgi:multiple sugar transport system substrate-binding protein